MPSPFKFAKVSAAMFAFVGASAVAAGGHFDVDDASVLDVGHCQYEAWLARSPARSATLLHVGPACRVGPVELGATFDRTQHTREAGTWLGTQLKWVVDPLIDRFSIGAAWNVAFDVTNRGRPAHTLYVPATWWAAERLWIHANAGIDWSPSGERMRRLGASVEWAATDIVTLIAERVTFSRDRTVRFGMRLSLNDKLAVDLSAARTGQRGARVFTIGLNQDFKR